MRIAVFYGRYSSSNQTEQSIEGQLHVCEKYAEQHDIHIIRQYVDRAISGTSDKRPQFLQMISDSKKGDFDTVLVYKLDRFARNRYDSAIYKKKLRDNGVKILSATEQLTDSPESVILEGMLESIDEYFSKELSVKCKRGLKESCDKGYYIGKNIPLGYKKVGRFLEIDPETLPIIQSIFEDYANGKSPERIAAELNAKGLTVRSRPFRRRVIRDWVLSETYIGRFHFGENIVNIPAAISPDLWERVQKRHDDIAHTFREHDKFRYYLTGRIYCEKCGGRVCGRASHNHNYYFCRECRKHIIQAPILHDKIKAALFDYLTPEKIKELAAAAYTEYKAALPADPTIALRAELKQIQTQIENGTKAILSGLDSESVRQALKAAEERSHTIANEIAACERHSPNLTQEHFEAILGCVLAYSEEDIEKLVGILVDRVIISKEHAVICINLTDETNEPPLEQIRISGGTLSAAAPYAYIINGWLCIAA